MNINLENYNPRSPGIKRLMREALELAESTEEYSANPLEDNLFEWHFTVRGPPNTDFQDGIYHGRILLPTQYPMKPPDIILLTPNGRFETNKKICLSISGHHPESWQPSWSIRTALLALIAFMPTRTIGAIGSLEYTPEERQMLARKSKNWECNICGKIGDKLQPIAPVKPLSPIETGIIKEIETIRELTPEEKEANEKVENLCAHSEPDDNIEVINANEGDELIIAGSEEPSFRDQIFPFIIFFLVVTIVVLLMRRLIVYSMSRT